MTAESQAPLGRLVAGLAIASIAIGGVYVYRQSRNSEDVPARDRPASSAEPAPAVYLPFDGTVDDAGPHQFRVERFGDELSFERGVRGQALWIGGTGDWLEVVIDERAAIAHGGTLELCFQREDWINPYGAGSGVQTLAAISSVMSLDIEPRGQWLLRGHVGWLNDAVRLKSADAGTASGRWYYAALTYDPDHGENRLYLNGRRLAQAVGRFQIPMLPPGGVRIGTWHKRNQAFRGLVDEVRLYTFPRTDEQIRRTARQYRLEGT